VARNSWAAGVVRQGTNGDFQQGYWQRCHASADDERERIGGSGRQRWNNR
jgi:hypothetical protein